MGLAIDGNAVHGLAVSGQSFKPLIENSDGSISANNRKYFSIPKHVTVSNGAEVELSDGQIQKYGLTNGYGISRFEVQSINGSVCGIDTDGGIYISGSISLQAQIPDGGSLLSATVDFDEDNPAHIDSDDIDKKTY